MPVSAGQRWRMKPLGVGIGLRREFYTLLPETRRALDWVEIIPENFLTLGGRPQATLDACRERWPLLPHGVALNVGGPDSLDEDYLAGLQALVERVDAPFFSDHLCYARLGGAYLYDLLPLPFSEEAVEHVVPRVREVQARVGRPFLLENPSYYAHMPGGTLAEADFLRHVVEQADCGLLLDVNNVYVNACNHGYDPRAFVDALPLERVGQLHLAGHERLPEVLLDTHGAPVCDEVWSLYQYVLERTGPVSTLIEWDAHIPSLDAVLDEADRARALMARVGAR
ncbi:MNIO family bufferin maturase [Melittangium boletus]|uniref:MNIO family bufferin maturase n=1 Tax=Melittangium boletus TaxID=83453 RepID=UPI003DA5CE99